MQMCAKVVGHSIMDLNTTVWGFKPERPRAEIIVIQVANPVELGVCTRSQKLLSLGCCEGWNIEGLQQLDTVPDYLLWRLGSMRKLEPSDLVGDCIVRRTAHGIINGMSLIMETTLETNLTVQPMQIKNSFTPGRRASSDEI